MDEIMNLEELKQSWKNLASEVKTTGKLSFETFEATFSQTYSLLSEYSTVNSVDKKHMGLIAEAYLFASIKDSTLGNTCLAAFVLTERMLDYCAFSTDTSGDRVPAVYVFELRRNIRLNFKNVTDSIYTLESVLKEIK